MTHYRVGVDVGGTFTDLICVTDDGEVLLDKTPTTLDDQALGVMEGIGQLADRLGRPLAEFCADLEIVVHGTTTADNTMIEMSGAVTGLITSGPFADVASGPDRLLLQGSVCWGNARLEYPPDLREQGDQSDRVETEKGLAAGDEGDGESAIGVGP